MATFMELRVEEQFRFRSLHRKQALRFGPLMNYSGNAEGRAPKSNPAIRSAGARFGCVQKADVPLCRCAHGLAALKTAGRPVRPVRALVSKCTTSTTNCATWITMSDAPSRQSLGSIGLAGRAIRGWQRDAARLAPTAPLDLKKASVWKRSAD
jgi:hypothetical protein